MAEVKQVRHKTDSDVVLDRAKDFWTRYNRPILIACGAIILLGGGWLAYKYLVKEPKEAKAAEAIWKAQSYFEQDSIQKALKGDGKYAGFEKVISEYGGTAQGNIARYDAGALALKSGDNDKAIKYLKDFSTDSKLIQARAYKLLGDAYANLNKNADALTNYKKAANEFKEDLQGSAEYLFFAAYFADRVMNDKKQAIELYQELVKKTDANSPFKAEAEKYLSQAGVYNVEEN